MKKIEVRKSDPKRPSDLRTSGKVSDPKRTTTPSTTITRRARPTKKNNRLKKIFLVAGGSLVLSVGLIALLSNTEAVGVFLTKTIKTLVSGLDDNTTPYDLDNQQPKQTQ
jgi:hypothetical protein